MGSTAKSRIISILVFCFCLNFVAGYPWALHIHRQDDSSAQITSQVITTSFQSTPAKTSVGDSSTRTQTQETSRISSSIPSSFIASATTTSSLATVITNTATSTLALSGDALYNATATPNKLPINPRITPGFAVSGVLLLISGVGYTLIGTKKKLLHISLSAAYLSSLGVTVLIIYVMNLPVSNAIQGAYVVAIVITGLILGGASTIFTELTEGLGSLFGGFCFSMWLLVLKPGGLLTSTGGIIAFIAAFTIAAYSTAFSHITRPYGLVVFTSFGGATSIVMGIDCFSRAGLKEFWAYIWQLNENLFPLGTTTYPHTRGLKVEIAAIILLALAGILSQLKIWKLIKKHRENRAADRLEDERSNKKQGENADKGNELNNESDRGQWGVVYGDKDGAKFVDHQRDSGFGDMDSQKKGPTSTVTSTRQVDHGEIEMSDISPTIGSGAGLVTTDRRNDGIAVTVRVAREMEPPAIVNENGEPIQHAEDYEDLAITSKTGVAEHDLAVMAKGDLRSEKVAGITTTPEVVSLPFKVPKDEIEDDRSSVATFADDEQIVSKRASILSTGSALLRRLSKRSQSSSKRFSHGYENESTEDLVVPHKIDEDGESSIAATLDDLSDDEDIRSTKSSLNFDREEGNAVVQVGNEEVLAQSADTSNYQVDEEAADFKNAGKSFTSSTDSAHPESEEAETVKLDTEHGVKNVVADSVVSTPESKPASISKDNLPAQLSKVVMSYRTNEWAKHLSIADAPELDELKLEEYPTEEDSAIKVEKVAPVMVEELQQTADGGSLAQTTPLAQRTLPFTSTEASPAGNDISSTQAMEPSPVSRTPSQYSQSSQPGLNSRMLSIRNSSAPNIPHQITESPIEQEFSPNHPYRNTLMSQRDTMLRSKSFISQPVSVYPTAHNYNTTTKSDSGSIVNHPTSSPAGMLEEDDNMSLSQRRSMIRQMSHTSNPKRPPPTHQNTFDSHQPKRQSLTAPPQVRQQQLASWRSSIQQDIQSSVPTQNTMARQRSVLLQERKNEEQKREMEIRRKEQRESAFDERMRRGDMLEAHRDALRKMQGIANKNAQ